MPHTKIQICGAICVTAAISSKAAAAPLQYLSGAGEKAVPVVWLTWGVLLISAGVIVIVAGLLAAAIWRHPRLSWVADQKTALEPDTGGMRWLWIGVGASALVLLVSVIWTVTVLADIQSPGSRPAVTIEVMGRQWWWQVHYLSGKQAGFYTANEIHIPVGQVVRLKLLSGDVIHSFWVPQLAGKMDAIPGQTNETWIEAARPGTYQGQCTEYCGAEHSEMLIRVIAQSPSAFHAWWAHQLTAPAVPAGLAASGGQAFEKHCSGCHSIRGTKAAGTLGPDLSHLMSRHTIASGVFPNNAVMLRKWVADPQKLKPGNLMPALPLSERDRDGIVNYLLALT